MQRLKGDEMEGRNHGVQGGVDRIRLHRRRYLKTSSLALLLSCCAAPDNRYIHCIRSIHEKLDVKGGNLYQHDLHLRKKRAEHNQVLFLCHLSLEFQSDHTWNHFILNDICIYAVTLKTIGLTHHVGMLVWILEWIFKCGYKKNPSR